MTNRTISHIIEPQLVIEGAGVLLRRSISPRASNEYDPFLLFDHFAFNNPLEGPIRGFPTHPHRGIETVTYMLEGSVNHRDSLGNAGKIGAGDVQWMTSGRGILHEEMPRRSENGNIYGFQLWVNLPAAQKMSQPRYQEVAANAIPVVEKDGVTIRLVAGEFDGVRGPVTEIAASPLYMDVKLAPGSSFIYPVPSGHTTLAYVFEGTGEFGEQIVESVSMVVFNDDGDQIEVKSESGVQFMLISGAPFKEPIVPYGPFVMNTVEEIQQAIQDLRNGTFVK
ncbi:pirin family protein [Candidatus Villigracilis saccharophilus]|uniref:pirin family protein n=1 Tax=Candidatus Villigracilis saccharophilus TaxID=3140684 RepID=UPI003136CF66|nr:pirin family protein [Anaerolineales bacterium]